MDKRRTRLAEAGLVAIAAVWGLTFVMVQDAVGEISAMAFLAYRFLPATLLVALVFRRRLGELDAEGWKSGLVMGVFLTSGYVFQTLGLERTTASNAGFITGMFVVLTPLFGALFLRHRPGRLAWLAAGVSTFGLFLLSGTGDEVNLTGDALVFLCACSFAGHLLVTDRAVRRHHYGALLAVQLGVCGSFSLVVAGITGGLEIPSSGTVWGALVVTSIFASALGFLVQTVAQRYAPPARTALILASEPAFAGLFAYLLADETLSAAGWVGAGLILVSIVAVELVPYVKRVAVLPEGTVAEMPDDPVGGPALSGD
ncbi:MAG TPA: DMT family transporter [Actinomycetota bacterium]|nr:DMT family transporter [Actinomycetota bacterium]